MINTLRTTRLWLWVVLLCWNAPVLAAPQRIVSLLPSLTETVCALGACERLVGVDRYSNWPASVKQLPNMGGGLDPNVEAIIAAAPDLVLVAKSARVLPRLRELGLNVAVLEPQTHADMREVTLSVSRLLDLPDARAQTVLQHNAQQLAEASALLPPQAHRWRVYFEVNDAPYAAGPNSFIGETLQALGLANVIPEAWGPFPRVSTEWVVAQQPDVIVIGDVAAASLAQRPGWSALRALQSQRVCAFAPAQADILVRAGPRLGQGALLIAQCIQRLANRPH